MSNRKLDIKRYHTTYTRLDVDWEVCIYCGDEGEITTDHVPAISLAALVDMDDRLLVPSCRPCNLMISNDGLDIQERAEILYKRLKRKYKKILSIPDWDEDELKDLGYNLRMKITKDVIVKTHISRRLENILDIHLAGGDV